MQKNLNPTLEVSTIVLVMYDARTKLSDQVVQEVREHFGDKVCRNIIPADRPAVRGAVVRSADHRVRSQPRVARSPTANWPRRSVVARRSGLGKGLGALIPSEVTAGGERWSLHELPGRLDRPESRTSHARTSTRRRWCR